ncbi:MAG: NAD-dependent epimerase/dehydratase family protein [Candidatus Methylumidiphilus sp.]
MKVLVTGAGGFVGRHLCAHLSACGHYVIAAVRRPGVVMADETVVAPDLAVGDLPTQVLRQCACVIHLAGRAHVLREVVADPTAAFTAANVTASRRLAQAAAAAGVGRFVLASSIGVNGGQTRGEPFSEASPTQPSEPYAHSKLAAERAVLEVAGQTAGMACVIVRPPLVYGPDAPGNFGLLLRLLATGAPLPFAALHAQRSLVSVWNLADFLRVCAEHEAAVGELFLVSDADDVSLPDIFRHLSEGYGRGNRLFALPPKLLALSAKLAGKGGAFAKLAAELRVDSRKAERLLGWRPPLSAAEGLRRTGREYREYRA